MNKKARKVMRKADNDQLDEAVFLWFVQKRSQGIPVSGLLLREKAVQLHAQMYAGESTPPFKASLGWLWRFCSCHGVTQLSLQGEKLYSDSSALEPFKKDLLQYIESNGLTLEQVYNCDETGLCYRMLPEKTLASRSEQGAPGMKKQKERVTLMACSNATGTHKLPLLFVGKAANPRCFKHVNRSALPVAYYSQKNAWVNGNIFSDWFHNQFVPAIMRHMTEGLICQSIAPTRQCSMPSRHTHIGR